MSQSFSPKTLLISLQQLSPQMLVLSTVLHGMLLAVPVSSFLPTKLPLATAVKNEEDHDTLPVTTSTELFSTDKTLVHPKPPVDASVTTETSSTVAQLPPLPTSEYTGIWKHSKENVGTQIHTDRMNKDTERQEYTDTENKHTDNEEELITPHELLSTSTLSSDAIIDSQKNATTKNETLLPNSTTRAKPSLKQKKKLMARSSQESISSSVVVSDFSTNPNTQKLYVDSLSAYVDKPNLQTYELIPPVSAKEAFDTTFINLGREVILTADLNFAEPDKFTLSQRGVENIFGTALGKTPDELALLMKSKLEAQGFQVSHINTYGGGPFCEVKKGTFIQYISFAPTANGTGAIIVTWKTAPV
ncbi:hypothetical protein BZZ01_05525 [Nostocales cyanobacterium HT-58-2]|nr:hypothetical protein BZZ01_05525 [Nostocales cyanobacterium HT-58-2]